MPRAKWGLRLNGIREGGALYRSWEDGREALLKRLNRLGYEQRRQGNAAADDERASETLRIISQRRETPRQNIKAKCGRYTLELTREPFQ